MSNHTYRLGNTAPSIPPNRLWSHSRCTRNVRRRHHGAYRADYTPARNNFRHNARGSCTVAPCVCLHTRNDSKPHLRLGECERSYVWSTHGGSLKQEKSQIKRVIWRLASGIENIRFVSQLFLVAHTSQWCHMSVMAYQIIGSSNVCTTSYTFQHQREQTSKLHIIDILWGGIHRSPVDSPYKGAFMWKVFPCYDVIMTQK